MSSRATHPLLSYQPVKVVFQLAYIGSILIRLPLWMVNSLVPFLRPHPRWTFKQTLMSRISYAALDMQSRCGVTETLSTQPAKEGDRFQVAKPSDSALYQGVLNHADTKPATVGGTWFPQAPGQDAATKTVVLYLHGGAFVQGDGRHNFCNFVGTNFVKHGNVDYLFAVQYRLSGYGLNPFPAAVQDAFSAYNFLLTKAGIKPERIVLAGDSAGGNLAIALLRYIEEHGKELKIPPPKCCALFSPWTAPYDFNITENPNFSTDWLPRSFLRWGAHVYGASVEKPESHRYITPLGNPFATSVPIFVNSGSLEIFDHNITKWAKEMADKGSSVELNREMGAPHDTMLLGDLFGFEDTAKDVAAKVGLFVSAHTKP
ncbi:alpha/beta hydrolase fold-3 domain-containing protein [Astrocystis sublimbata]|nr:alpha/beta hydrolase fold-3 domain-containing protein [Astrocystis sublimbata]